MRSPRTAGVLAALAVVLAPLSVGTASAAGPGPEDCHSKTGYSKEGNGAWSSEVKVCFNTTIRYEGGYNVDSPGEYVQARCWHKGLLYNERNCKLKGKLTLRKDGQEIWTEDRELETEYLHSGHIRTEHRWTCRGPGEYSLTLHDITLYAAHGGISNTWVPVYLDSVRVTEDGC
ncbi:hypothetical protein [Streptomyces sp. NPDC058440]|uniref:hypothetical protein n=1 Tax=unclassified Streptomyces TaxID=2593676 RepID=UPI003647487F